MNVKSKVIINVRHLNDAETAMYAQGILAAMGKTTHYPLATSLVTGLQDAYEDFVAKLSIAATGNRSQIAEKNNAKKDLREKIAVLGSYINFAIPNNRPAQLTTGYLLNKDVRGPAVMEAFRSFKISYGALSGSLDLRVKKGKGTNSVVYQYTTTPPTNATQWISTTPTKGKYTISGLTPAQYVWVRAVAIGSRDQVLYTEPVQKLVV